VIVSDFLSVTVPSYFSVVLGLCFLAIVFYMPDGVLGLLQAWWRRFQKLRGERSK
jgi:branched-chain amino acid transport system permease protein